MQDEQKRISDTLEALAKAVTTHGDCVVTFFGDGPQRSALQTRVQQLGLENRIHFDGYVPHDRIQDELLKQHILVLLSDYEGIPGAVMDAMACGVVPICTAVSGIDELVVEGQTGILVADRGKEFQAALDRLLADADLWQQLSNSAKQCIFERYTLDGCAIKWQEFCQQLLNKANPSKALEIPKRFELPRVHPAFANEDIRSFDWRFVWRYMLDRYRGRYQDGTN